MNPGTSRASVAGVPPRSFRSPGPACSGPGIILPGLFTVLEYLRLSSAPRILGAECLPAGNALLSGPDHIQGQGVSIP
ncbi:MAG: hypothetical protein LBO77_06325 [Desulfovibrio sp.]|jgi:hypothetical protein|nr:hypothetical protein [Desulfovibrio sp.]